MTRATCLLGSLVAAAVYLYGSPAAHAAGCYDIHNNSKTKVKLEFLYPHGMVPQNGEISRELNPGTSHRYCEDYASGTIVMIGRGKAWSPKAPVFGVDKPGTYAVVDPKPPPPGLTTKQKQRKAKLERMGEGRYELLGYREITGCDDGFHFGSCEKPATKVKIRCLENDRVRNLVCSRNGKRCATTEHKFFNDNPRKNLPNHCPKPA